MVTFLANNDALPTILGKLKCSIKQYIYRSNFTSSSRIYTMSKFSLVFIILTGLAQLTRGHSTSLQLGPVEVVPSTVVRVECTRETVEAVLSNANVAILEPWLRLFKAASPGSELQHGYITFSLQTQVTWEIVTCDLTILMTKRSAVACNNRYADSDSS